MKLLYVLVPTLKKVIIIINNNNTIEANKPYTTETSQTNMENSEENTLSGNGYKELIIDDESDFSDMVQSSGIKITRYANQEDNIIKGQRENKINKKPRNKTDIYNKGNHVPGNLSYSEITKDGKNVLPYSTLLTRHIINAKIRKLALIK